MTTDSAVNGIPPAAAPLTADPALAGEGGPPPTEAPPLEDRATSSPALPDPQPKPDPTPDPLALPVDDGDDPDDDVAATLPHTLEEAHAEILRMRKWKQKKLLEYRNARDGKRTAEQSVSGLQEQLTNTTAKLEQRTSELAVAKAARETAEAERDAATGEVTRYRDELLSRFKPGQREIAEALPTDKIPAYFEQVNGRALLSAPEPAPSPARHVVTREAAPKRKAEGFDDYFDAKK